MISNYLAVSNFALTMLSSLFESLMIMSYQISKEKFNMHFHTLIFILLHFFGIKACPSRRKWNGVVTTTRAATTYSQVPNKQVGPNKRVVILSKFHK